MPEDALTADLAPAQDHQSRDGAHEQQGDQARGDERDHGTGALLGRHRPTRRVAPGRVPRRRGAAVTTTLTEGGTRALGRVLLLHPNPATRLAAGRSCGPSV